MWIVNLKSQRTTAYAASTPMKSLTTAPMTGVNTAVIHMNPADQSIFYKSKSELCSFGKSYMSIPAAILLLSNFLSLCTGIALDLSEHTFAQLRFLGR